MADYEKLGAFYLGRLHDIDSETTSDELLLYDSKDLTTHAVCVGMTGSGKTGLCLSLLEEAAIDGIPALAIDPKGDLGNLMLTFPGLRPADFRPWVDPGEAGRKGLTPDAYAADRAKVWREGLSSWNQDGGRIARFRDAADVAIYTPGSTAGLPLCVLRSLRAPASELIEDDDAMRDRVSATVSGLLGLLGIAADPIQSREHIFLANVLDCCWRSGGDLDIATLITQVQSPPFDKLGVMDLESFFPAKERFALAMTLNNLLASPAFSGWMEGEALDIDRLLHTAEGKPRISILSIAHLGDAERMFFVTLVLNEVISWMRRQPGTATLRTVLYMDEIFGFFPPTAKPASKIPMLTLLKQARAYGLGVVLATQNPVDLDYKGLGNTGTWFIGRLQTQRDKQRLLDGLEGTSAAANLDRGRIEALLSRLRSRVFLMNNVHEDAPAMFHTRWVLSYLRGPLTRSQIRTLMDPRRAEVAAGSAGQPSAPRGQRRAPAVPARLAAATAAQNQSPSVSAAPPALPPEVPCGYLPVTRAVAADETLRYHAGLVGVARLHFVRKSAKVDDWRTVALLAALDDGVDADPWGAADEVPPEAVELERRPDGRGRFAAVPAAVSRKTSFKKWSRGLIGQLYREQTCTVLCCKALKEHSRLDESTADFRARLRHTAREQRDLKVEKLRKRYAPKLARLEDRVRRAEARVEREQSQVTQSGLQTAVSFGATILGAMFGRKKASLGTVGRAASTVRRAGRTASERGDVARAREDVEAVKRQLAELEHEFEAEVEQVRDSADVDALDFEDITVRPRKADIAVQTLAVAWTPYRVGPDGGLETAWIPAT